MEVGWGNFATRQTRQKKWFRLANNSSTQNLRKNKSRNVGKYYSPPSPIPIKDDYYVK